MALEVVYGETRNGGAARRLAEALASVVNSGIVYLGYPVLATADERVEVDALLVSRDRGLVAFRLADNVPATAEAWVSAVEEQDQMYTALSTHLLRHETLRRGRRPAFDLHTATVFAEAPPEHDGERDGFYGDLQQIPGWVGDLGPLDPSIETALQAALQRVELLRSNRRRSEAP